MVSHRLRFPSEAHWSHHSAMGEEGVTKALQIIHKELDLSMAFCGRTDINAVGRDILMKRR